MNETNAAMIQTRYIEGLRDKDVRDRAFIDGIELKEVVKMATRKEALTAKETEFMPWNSDQRLPAIVAAVSRNDKQQLGPTRPRPERDAPYNNRNRYGERNHGKMVGGAGYKNSNRGQGRDNRNGGERSRCDRCGVVEH